MEKTHKLLKRVIIRMRITCNIQMFIRILIISTIWKKNIKIGTWNARSLFGSAALKLLHNKLSNLDFSVVALHETRLESGIQKFDNFALFNVV
jgi:hypothetical protein